MKRLLSIEDLVAQTSLEESLIRYYESEYADKLPEKTLRGNSLLFTAETVEALKRIHSLHTGQLSPIGSSVTPQKQFARVIAITSGKGGVGKSNIALNLALSFQRLGKMSLVLDADLGMANIHILAGLQPKYTLRNFIDSDLQISDLIMPGPGGIGIVAGGSGILKLADSTHGQRRKMISALEQIELCTDIIIVDTAAGMGAEVRDFLFAADEIVFVLSPEITSLADAYGLLKSLCSMGFKGPMYSVVNMVFSLNEAAEVGKRFADCARQFLGATVDNIGYIMRDSSVRAAIAARRPYCLFAPDSRVAKNTANIAAALLKEQDSSVILHSAFKRYKNLLEKT
jgi:flagellar biosynthesis protein FlhG